MATVITIQAVITIAQSNRAPVIDEQPPEEVEFKTGVPQRVPFGKASDQDNDTLAVRLTSLVPGCTVEIAPTGQIELIWSGEGAPGEYPAAVEVDDGKAA